MRFLTIFLLSLAILSPHAAIASPTSDTLGTCLKDNTNGKDRKALARWIFLAISAHPEIRQLSVATDAIRLDSDKGTAVLVTRLLTENCRAETRAVVAKDGNPGLFSAFKLLGEVAMTELMTDPGVSAAISNYAQFVDKKKIEEVLTK